MLSGSALRLSRQQKKEKRFGIGHEGGKAKAVPLPALPMNLGGEVGGVTNVRPSSPDEKDAASTLASLFSSGGAQSFTPTVAKAGESARGVRGRFPGEVDEDMDEEDDGEPPNDGVQREGDEQPHTSSAILGKRARAGGEDGASKKEPARSPVAAAAASSSAAKKPHAMVDHTYTDYSVVDEELLAEIDRREKVLSDAGDVVKFIEEAERSVWTRQEGTVGRGLGGPYRKVLSEAEERERQEKMNKLQEMLHGKLGGPRRNSGGVAQPFPLKLMEVLGQEEYNHIASWMPHGRAFIVHNPKAFTAEILPRFFKQTKFMSFTRQLNLWGFKRITRRGNPDAGAYYHELFLRGRPRLSTRMRREKIKGTGIKLSPNPDAEPDFYKMAKERPLLTSAEEAKQLQERARAQEAAAAAEVSITASPVGVPALPTFPGNAATGGVGVGRGMASPGYAASLLRQRNELRQLNLVGQMKALQAVREEQRKTSNERAAIECAAAFAAKQQQQAAAAAALAARAAQRPQDAAAILGQLLTLNTGGGVPTSSSNPLQGLAADGFSRRMNAAMAMNGPGAPQQQANTEDLLRSLQRQNAAAQQQLNPTADLLLGSGANRLLGGGANRGLNHSDNNSDALAALTAKMSGGGGGGRATSLLAPPDPVFSAAVTGRVGSPSVRMSGASSAGLSTEATLLRTLLLEQQQQQQKQLQGTRGGVAGCPLPSPPLASARSGGMQGGVSGGGGGLPSDLLAAAMAARQRSREVVSATFDATGGAAAEDTSVTGEDKRTRGGRGGPPARGDTPANSTNLSVLFGSSSLSPQQRQQMADRLNSMGGMGFQNI